FPHSIPGTERSKVYLARPVTLSGPSSRVWRPLTTASFESRSQGLRSPSATWTTSVCGSLAWPTLTRWVTVGFVSTSPRSWAMALSLPRSGVGRLLHGLEHARVRSAAAEVAGQPVLDLVEGGMRD